MDANTATPEFPESAPTAASPEQDIVMVEPRHAGLDEIDFDAGEANEAAAIETAAALLAPRFVIVEKSLAVKFPSGEIIKIALDVPWETFQELIEGNLGESEQLMQLLDIIGQGEAKAVLLRQGTVAVMATAAKYFATWEKVIGATMGESYGSGRSA